MSQVSGTVNLNVSFEVRALTPTPEAAVAELCALLVKDIYGEVSSVSTTSLGIPTSNSSEG